MKKFVKYQMAKRILTLLAACMWLGFVASAQNLLLNGSFESPFVATNSISSLTPTSWTWGGGGAGGLIHSGNSGNATIWPLPEDGQQCVDVGNTAGTTLSQPFTVTSEGVHVLSWFDSSGTRRWTYQLTIFGRRLNRNEPDRPEQSLRRLPRHIWRLGQTVDPI